MNAISEQLLNTRVYKKGKGINLPFFVPNFRTLVVSKVAFFIGSFDRTVKTCLKKHLSGVYPRRFGAYIRNRSLFQIQMYS